MLHSLVDGDLPARKNARLFLAKAARRLIPLFDKRWRKPGCGFSQNMLSHA
jgi:hypothetical protein